MAFDAKTWSIIDLETTPEDSRELWLIGRNINNWSDQDQIRAIRKYQDACSFIAEPSSEVKKVIDELYAANPITSIVDKIRDAIGEDDPIPVQKPKKRPKFLDLFK